MMTQVLAAIISIILVWAVASPESLGVWVAEFYKAFFMEMMK